jgi:hypothetical protein
VLEIVLLQRPVVSALEHIAFEIVKASLVPRSQIQIHDISSQETMRFQDWDSFGKKGTPSHLMSSWGSSFLEYLDSSVWALFFLLMGIIVLFVIVCLVIIFACDCCTDEYEQAQHGKARGEKKRQKSGDVEMGRRFKSAEELGLLGKGRVVGIGKRD